MADLADDVRPRDDAGQRVAVAYDDEIDLRARQELRCLDERCIVWDVVSRSRATGMIPAMYIDLIPRSASESDVQGRQDARHSQ